MSDSVIDQNDALQQEEDSFPVMQQSQPPEDAPRARKKRTKSSSGKQKRASPDDDAPNRSEEQDRELQEIPQPFADASSAAGMGDATIDEMQTADEQDASIMQPTDQYEALDANDRNLGEEAPKPLSKSSSKRKSSKNKPPAPQQDEQHDEQQAELSQDQSKQKQKKRRSPKALPLLPQSGAAAAADEVDDEDEPAAVSAALAVPSLSLRQKIDPKDMLQYIIDQERKRLIEATRQELDLEEQQLKDQAEKQRAAAAAGQALDQPDEVVKDVKAEMKSRRKEAKKKLDLMTQENQLRKHVLRAQKQKQLVSKKHKAQYVENPISGKFKKRNAAIHYDDGSDDSDLEDGLRMNQELEYQIYRQTRKFRTTIREVNRIFVRLYAFLRGIMAGWSVLQVFTFFVPGYSALQVMFAFAPMAIVTQAIMQFIALLTCVCTLYILANDLFPSDSVAAMELHYDESDGMFLYRDETFEQQEAESIKRTGKAKRQLQTRRLVRGVEAFCYIVALLCTIFAYPSTDYWYKRTLETGNAYWFQSYFVSNASVSDAAYFAAWEILYVVVCTIRAFVCLVSWILSSMFLHSASTTRQHELTQLFDKHMQEKFAKMLRQADNEQNDLQSAQQAKAGQDNTKSEFDELGSASSYDPTSARKRPNFLLPQEIDVQQQQNIYSQ